MVPGPGAAADSIELKRVRQEVQREVTRVGLDTPGTERSRLMPLGFERYFSEPFQAP
jgi:hypothetical protein